MKVAVKVCGNTRLDDARTAAELGADALGFIFYPASPRHVTPEKAAAIVRELPPYVVTVGVFVNEKVETMNRVAETCRLDRIQLHGGESHGMLARLNRPGYRALRPRDEDELARLIGEADTTVLLDTYDPGLPGGTGRTFIWDWARRAGATKRVILAGGLDAGNVAAAVESARPVAVDVVSSLESAPGRKDPDKMEAFFRALRGPASPSSLKVEEHASAS